MGTALNLRKTVEEMGGAEGIYHGLRRFSNDARWFHSTRNALLKQYPDQWVAVYEGKVAISAPSFEELNDAMDANGVPRGEAVVVFLDTNPKSFIF